MNKRWLLALTLLTTVFAGCVDDAGDGDDGTDDGSTGSMADAIDDSHMNGGPRGFLPDDVTGMEFVTNAVEGNARGIWLNDDTAYVSGVPGLRILDITNPAEPKVLAQDVPDTDGGGSRDIDFLDHPNGRDYVAMSRGGVSLVDVSDPTNPVVVSAADVSSHNMAVVPNTTLVYNSLSINTGPAGETGTTGKIDIIDFADPEEPVVTEFWFPAVIQTPAGIPKTVDATTCHDITFSITDDHQWAYCAGISETHIWDISEPTDPQIIQVVTWPGNQIHHGAWGARDGDILIIGDEFAGAAAGACTTSDDPYASLWFFDVSDIETPTPLGYHRVDYTSDDPRALCTTHFGTLVEDRDLFVLGWYAGGVSLVDFSDPTAPVEIDSYRPDGSFSVWEARYYKGHVYTGDSARGVDVLRII